MAPEFEFDGNMGDFDGFLAALEQELKGLLDSMSHIHAIISNVGGALTRGSTLILTATHTGTEITGVTVIEIRPKDRKRRWIVNLSLGETVAFILRPLGSQMNEAGLVCQFGEADRNEIVFKPAAETG